MISDDGIIIRIPADEIAVQSRYGSGVIVMRLAENSKVVTLSAAPKEDDDEEEIFEENSDTSENTEIEQTTENSEE